MLGVCMYEIYNPSFHHGTFNPNPIKWINTHTGYYKMRMSYHAPRIKRRQLHAAPADWPMVSSAGLQMAAEN